jgi:UDP-glucose 4-epimerase
MRVVVTGATGMIGPQLVNYLVSNGHQVRTISRRQSEKGLFRKGVKSIQADICSDKKRIRQVFADADAVFHLAAKLHVNNPSADLDTEYYQVNVRGSEKVAEAAYDCGVARLVHFSTINVYGACRNNEIISEESSLRPETIYARTKVQSEEAVWDILRRNERSSAVVLRMAAVYGPRLQGNYKHLVKALKYRCFYPVGKGENRRTLIYIDDLVRGALLAASHPKANGGTFNLTDGCIHTFNDIIHSISFALGRKAPRGHLPEQPIRRLSAFTDKTFHLIGANRIAFSKFLDKLTEDVAVSGEKFITELKFQARYSLIQGWRKAVGR